MRVEPCCQALLSKILPEVDNQRSGVSIDIGVGTFAFYFMLFHQLGFETIAVEPLPNDQVKSLSREHNIRLIESCVSETDGFVSLYVGRNENNEEETNLNSMRSNWWGSSQNAIEVPSQSLSNLLAHISANEVTGLKIDVEGMEFSIIKQLLDIRENWIPKVLMFEYGGGGIRENEQGGWSKDIVEETVKSLEILSSMGYSQLIIVDQAPDLPVRLLSLESLVLEPAAVFPDSSIYGNIIALRENLSYFERQIHAICKPYKNNKNRDSRFKKMLSRLLPGI